MLTLIIAGLISLGNATGAASPVGATVPAASEQPSRNVEVEGRGISEAGALQDALRNAAEQAVGVLVDARTVMRDYQVRSDSIRTFSEAFVSSYEVQSRERQADGTFVIKLRATVNLGSIRDGLEALAILQSRKHHPAFAVISERATSSSSDFANCEPVAVPAVIRYLQERLMNVVDQKRVEAEREADMLGARTKPQQLTLSQRIANRLSADIYVTVSCQIEESASINVRFHESSTGRVLGEESAYAPPIQDASSRKKAIEQATTVATARAFDLLLSYWRRDTSQGSPLTIIANGLDFQRKSRFREILQSIATDVRQLNASRGHAEFIIWTTESLSEVIEEIYRKSSEQQLGISERSEPDARGNRVIFTFENR
ncbi:MAG: hypothetical protein HY692_02330 [Cyanobacteria bacterium NC_groundwater_1444_Ag_S-0.65um_54_12]|nr:hypothetical protein [Cyanobacteria bacterium NC_groundwater_1444_Ag_S-0.65um_54_12]